jgi:hypothetical protein
MKIVFNFNRATRGTLLGALVVLAAILGAAAPARAEGVYFSREELLKDFFRTSERVTWERFDLGAELRGRLAKRLGYAPAHASYTFFVATTAGHVDGYALFDEETGEHLPISFAVKLSPRGVVERQEITCYREPRGDEVRDASFRKQFVGKSALDPIAADLDIVAVSGATISSRAMAQGVKRAVVLFEALIAPRLTLQVTARAAATAGPARGPGAL